MKYFYNQIDRSAGYAWNMVQRILNTIGIKPILTCDTGGQTVIEFTRELTPTEKTQLDTVMVSNPTVAPTNAGTTFVIRDVWNQRAFFQQQIGLTYNVYYSESVPGSGIVDQVELHFPTTLTNTQKNKVISEYGKLVSVK